LVLEAMEGEGNRDPSQQPIYPLWRLIQC
jgi:hypothetical protein